MHVDENIELLPQVRSTIYSDTYDCYYVDTKRYHVFRNNLIKKFREKYDDANDKQPFEIIEKLIVKEEKIDLEFLYYVDRINPVNITEYNNKYKATLEQIRSHDIEIRHRLKYTTMWLSYEKIEKIFLFNRKFKKFLDEVPVDLPFKNQTQQILDVLDGLLEKFYSGLQSDEQTFETAEYHKNRLETRRQFYKKYHTVFTITQRYENAWQYAHIMKKIDMIFENQVINNIEEVLTTILRLTISIPDGNIIAIDDDTQHVRVLFDIDKDMLITENTGIVNEHMYVIDMEKISRIYLPIEIENREHGSIFRHFRNNRKANCILRNNAIYATTNIRANEELFIDISDEDLIERFYRTSKKSRDEYIRVLFDDLFLTHDNTHNNIDLKLRINMLHNKI